MSWFRREKESQTSPPLGAASAPEVKDLAAVTRIAREHLDAETAERWLAMVRPAVRLVAACDGDAVIARFGGRPVVPAEFAWPVWEGAGPLSFVGEIDLAALAATGLETGIELPVTGRFLAFYFDGSYNNFESVVGTWDRESLAGARLIHISEPRTSGASIAPPTGVDEFGELLLSGRQITTYPGWDHPLLAAEFDAGDQDSEAWPAHPVQSDEFNEALLALDEDDSPRHQIGGWADAVQGPVELEVAQAAIPGDTVDDDAAVVAEASVWRPLLQVDSDDGGLMWGDLGTLYWLRRESAQPASDLDLISFTWQC
ncbi:YwqG family protein [Nocardioides sp. Bht2]|uniref:YwqG family protein n=1 Tax=Nocardioides sp. Bht2 TaxID=3392297 RepID=UPI0039B4E829